MSDQDAFDQSDAAPRRVYGGPHSGKHPIPTVQGYRQHRKELGDQVQEEEQAQRGPEDDSKTKRAFRSAKAIFKDEDAEYQKNSHDPYPSANLSNAESEFKATSNEDTAQTQKTGPSSSDQDSRQTAERDAGKHGKRKGNADEKSATEAAAGTSDPREKRKAMKKKQRQGEGREVTDPVTHLPIVIHDQTGKDLDSVPENEPEPGTHHTTASGPAGASKSEEKLRTEQDTVQRVHNGMIRVFPPPDFESTKQELAVIYKNAVYTGLSIIVALVTFFFILPVPFAHNKGPELSDTNSHGLPSFSTLLSFTVFLGLGAATVVGMGQWVNKKTSEIFEDETWDASLRQEQAIVKSDEELPESAHWLNSFIGSIWPLVNPDLFTSLVDQIEDVMQASLPKAIKMVSVDDMGQGSESVRILGVRWLPTGAASQSVGSDGQLHKGNDASESDRTDPGNSQEVNSEDHSNDDSKVSRNNESSQQQEQDEATLREGMEAEEGDFVNLELALAYRSRSSSKSFRTKAKNAHLYLKFYLPGGICVPVWVELRGIVMTLRLRLQLTPDPPFIELCTMTFLGQPKASISCMPLSKHSFSLTDVPLISSFVNSAIDAALAEYVAPKSLTLNLKDMLVGEDFKKDTTAVGVVWIFIKRASGFKQGDAGIGPIQGSSDAYVTVSWGKFGKAVASTRIAIGENEPSWHEYASILVTPEEVNADEKLRLQLWDSDKWTADDDLGRVEVDLKDLMHKPETLNKMQSREDGFSGENVEEDMPGSLVWSVGYFTKTRITKQQLEAQTFNESIRTKDELKRHVSVTAERKLREANKPPDDEEVKQQKTQDYHELENSMIVSAPPSTEFISGVLSVQIHNITGLEIRKLQKEDKNDAGDQEDEAEHADDMPNSYCTIILNHKKIFKTRTKPKNSKPFFNAGTERFIRDWRATEVIVSVRDAREREDDALIGLVYLPLSKIFKDRSQVMGNYSLVGGVGFGKARISMVWRSVNVKLPPQISGWDYGTLQIRGPVRPKSDFDNGLTSHRIKIRTNTGRIKLYPSDGAWKGKGGKEPQDAFLAVRKRYSSAMVVEFRQSSLGSDKTSAFAVLWLHELRDEEDETKCLKVWKGNKKSFHRAQTCCEFDGSGSKDELLGEIEVNVRFWRGLSGYHKSYAARSKNEDMRNVMECLDTISDEGLEGDIDDDTDSETDSTGNEGENNDDTRRKKLRMHTNDDSTPSSTDDEDDGKGSSASSSSTNLSLSDFKKVKNIFRNPVDGVTEAATSVLAPGHNDSEDGTRGLRGQMRDYKDHYKQLHRKHRGIMQWRAAREVNHIGGKVTRLKGNVGGLFRHDDKDGGIETEV
ncbi:hypothetical protein F5B22DRAFT_602992 [Xylaria bambusicola]|uniref:uncharacterized protein n=1 Tax=Xylaria bambusicola TaxID=326684 RepID=UPI0020084EE5|nr:uncharacterized protein F5B22DRAFT_602992 [Xylaria bambusicola]KAI0517445.1 hypothetical protein F5B22DRAFT_602992 [Xylaria bambusicola]